MPQFVGSLAKYPARASFAWYLALIVVGAALLTRPVCHASDARPITWLDALFTATSAGCVTGLTVRSTENDFSFLGQLVILLLIQLGGIGIMTVTTYITFQWGGRAGLRQAAAIQETLGGTPGQDLRRVIRHVIRLTLVCEGAGFLLLAARNLLIYPLPEALWRACFHSVSAFCNAGFALADDSLTRFQGDPFVNLTISGLIIVGGIGYPVIFDVLQSFRQSSWADRWRSLLLHSKLMLLGTALLLAWGTVSFAILEWDGALESMGPGRKLLAAAFQSVNCRTAGFNTIDIGDLNSGALLVMILLMAIGAGPCSTAGGFKVSAFMTLIIGAWATWRGRSRVNVFRRTIPNRLINRAVTTVLVFAAVAIAGLTTILFLEQTVGSRQREKGLFVECLFEVTSALGTVGLSTGLTTRLGSASRLVLAALMFLGRLGPITAFVAVSRGEPKRRLEYPHEEPLLG